MHQMLGIRKVLEGINTLRACFVLFIYDKSSFGIFVFRQVAPTTRRSVGWAVDMFSSRLVLPVSLERLACPPSREVRDAVERSNANVLAFLLLEVDLEAMPRSADERLVEALAPLRTKLDMIIDMLGRLSYRDVELPPLSDIELSSTRIAWHSSHLLQPGDWLRIKLYFHPLFREPVVLFGNVTVRADEGETSGCHVQAELSEQPEFLAENIARLALLTQRRQRAHRPIQAAAKGER